MKNMILLSVIAIFFLSSCEKEELTLIEPANITIEQVYEKIAPATETLILDNPTTSEKGDPKATATISNTPESSLISNYESASAPAPVVVPSTIPVSNIPTTPTPTTNQTTVTPNNTVVVHQIPVTEINQEETP